MAAEHDRGAVRHTVETLEREIGAIVAERQTLCAAGVLDDVLEENLLRLARAQAQLTHLLLERHLVTA